MGGRDGPPLHLLSGPCNNKTTSRTPQGTADLRKPTLRRPQEAQQPQEKHRKSRGPPAARMACRFWRSSTSAPAVSAPGGETSRAEFTANRWPPAAAQGFRAPRSCWEIRTVFQRFPGIPGFSGNFRKFPKIFGNFREFRKPPGNGGPQGMWGPPHMLQKPTPPALTPPFGANGSEYNVVSPRRGVLVHVPAGLRRREWARSGSGRA